MTLRKTLGAENFEPLYGKLSEICFAFGDVGEIKIVQYSALVLRLSGILMSDLVVRQSLGSHWANLWLDERV